MASHILEPNEVRQMVNNALGDFFDQQISKAEDLDSRYGNLWRVAKDVVVGGGKRIRPYLMLLSYTAYGGKNFNEALPVAMSIELLHQCMLIHDDVIDHDYIRHGQPNVSGYLQVRYAKLGNKDTHMADSGAILAGDLLLSEAYQLILNCNLNGGVKKIVINKLGDVVYEVGAGQLLDVESAVFPTDQDIVLKIAELKTARYSIGIPLTIGAVLAGADEKELVKLRSIGDEMGIAYQLRDDVLGMFGEEKKTGKSNLGDLREGKQTLLIIKAMEIAGQEDRAKLQANLGNPKANLRQLAEVRKIIENTGSKEYSSRLINSYIAKAEKEIQSLKISVQAMDKLVEMANSLRKY